ncbi:peptidoglycan DD-metalloendopeptidase family protein [Bacillus pumilus]|uniref:M23 family metallopeptidase n=1 Tax=Bacillus pumilus TaxID=1408 RepID=UPI00017A6515|nr:M23 family metallopeptidase [Bacillus pumilus]EDW21027.1 M23 family peptidase [Bacillus pumilus ATCC 7061]MCR4353777.1 M23 family metallopeptidase [Bacillus pumilus]MCY7504790.1 peptidoglycan DD-metalloendopeptidase family protein [Bacillus pumilus]MDR4269841.1 peptidoglycan DD-metalloendopeptidase family protein [Bacillus pumilus]MED4627731.1 M23 family metallopeptidase [Bacillus pumilus]
MKRYCFICASCFLMIFSPVAYAQETSEWVEPIKGEVTDLFGTRGGSHMGLDIAAPEGESIFAASEGEVSRSYVSATYGEVVFIQHPNGYETVYAHLHERFVKKGDHVEAGQPIGIIGNTGASRGTHLHFEVHRGHWSVSKEDAVDPLTIIAMDRFQEPALHVNGQENNTYLIKQGDTLWSIAKEHEMTVEQLKQINELTTHLIRTGDRLMVSKK